MAVCPLNVAKLKRLKFYNTLIAFVPKYKLAQEIMAPSESTLFVLFERFDKQPLPSTMVQIWEEG